MKYTAKNNGVTACTPTRLLDQVRDRLRVRHYSLRTAGAPQLDTALHPGRRRSTATYCVSIGITRPTKSLMFTISSSGVTVHNRARTTSNATNKKTAQCAVFSSHLLPTDQGRRASASTSLALGSRSCLVTANGPMLSIGTATITEEITTITAPIMCVSARPSIDSPP